MKATGLLTAMLLITRVSCGANGIGFSDLVGAKSAAILAAPDSVKAWRTVGSLLNTNHPAENEQYYQKSGDGIPVSTNLASQLGRVLLSTNTYLLGWSTSCIAQPGVVISFSKGTNTVDLFFCFECGILLIDSATDPKKWLSQTSHKNSFFERVTTGINATADETSLPPKYIRAPVEPHNASIEIKGDLLFAPGRAKLLGIIKQIFPKDPQIQSLEN